MWEYTRQHRESQLRPYAACTKTTRRMRNGRHHHHTPWWHHITVKSLHQLSMVPKKLGWLAARLVSYGTMGNIWCSYSVCSHSSLFCCCLRWCCWRCARRTSVNKTICRPVKLLYGEWSRSLSLQSTCWGILTHLKPRWFSHVIRACSNSGEMSQLLMSWWLNMYLCHVT